MYKKVAYLGFNEDMILELLDSNNFKLKYIITQHNRLTKPTIKLLEMLKIPIYTVKNKGELKEYINLFNKVDIILINFFGIIVPNEIVNRYKCFNIHTGDLATNRGPYPLVWSILNNDEKAVSVLYRLGAKVDTGEIISKYEIKIEEDDTNESLSNKLNSGIKYHLEKLNNYNEKNKYEVIESGTYRKKVKEEDILIKEEDTIEKINRKINSQKSYGGALLKYKNMLLRVSEIVKKETE